MNKVCVAVNETFTDNNGAEDVAFLWDGEKLSYAKANGYGVDGDFVDKVDASIEQIKEASEWYRYNSKPSANPTGERWEVKRSRKIKSGHVVKVLEYYQSEWNGQYKTTEQVKVSDPTDGIVETISINCLEKLVEGRLKWWMIKSC